MFSHFSRTNSESEEILRKNCSIEFFLNFPCNLLSNRFDCSWNNRGLPPSIQYTLHLTFSIQFSSISIQFNWFWLNSILARLNLLQFSSVRLLYGLPFVARAFLIYSKLTIFIKIREVSEKNGLSEFENVQNLLHFIKF